jgi:hypothetical protein
MTNRAAQDVNGVRRPGVAALECSVDRTQTLLAEFRDEITHLVAKVHRDVDRLREAALGEPRIRPTVGPDRIEEEDGECRLADIVGEERAVLRIRTMMNEVIDERFTTLTNLIQTKLAHGANPFQNLRAGPSRRKR